MVHTVVGIDPGLDGGLVALDASGRVIRAMRTPTLKITTASGKTRRLLNVVEIAGFLRRHADPDGKVVIEDVFSSPQMGVVGAFSFGEGKGALRGVCGTLGLDVLWVSPLTWKGKLGLLPPRGKGMSKAEHKKALKQVAIAKAKKFFPEEAGMDHDGVAEAGLLAAYGLLQSSRRSISHPASTQPQSA
ncbi:MAG: hypothetical protein ACXW13_00100 [Burkholderiaceae bacterium]